MNKNLLRHDQLNARSKSVIAIIPARDEVLAIGAVVRETCALRDVSGCAVFERVIVVDNGSTDGTAAAAEAAGALAVSEARKGYGAACWAGLESAGSAEIVVFIDGDASTAVDQVPQLLQEIRRGSDLVIGVRLSGRQRGMTRIQRFGNGLASALILCLWFSRVRDLGPFRAVSMSALQAMKMQDRAFGWTVEMQVKAIQMGIRTAEVDVAVRPRLGQSKISGTFSGVIGAGFGIIWTILKLRLSAAPQP